MTSNERPGVTTGAPVAGEPAPSVQPAPDIEEQDCVISRSLEVEPKKAVADPAPVAPWRHRRRWPRCGCVIDSHDAGCPRAELHQRLLDDPFPRPRLSVDDELGVVNRLHIDAMYAAQVLARLSELFGIAS